MSTVVNVDDAKLELTNLRKIIESFHQTNQEIPKHITQLTPSQHGEKKIKHFKRIGKKIKEEFKKGQKIADIIDLKAIGPTGSGAETGKKWHTSLKKSIDNPSTSANKTGNAVIDAVKEWLKDGNDRLELLQSEFPLYGYMFEEVDGVSEISFWNGKADAIGLYKGNYVIVDWKAVDLLEFWEKRLEVYKAYLHQCLVYARLLMLHLKLEKLPHILIVPISNVTGREIRPSWFYDFPKACKDKIEQYTWTKDPEQPIRSLPRGMVNNADGILGEDGFINNKKKVSDVLKNDCTVEQLLDALGLDFLKLKIAVEE